MAFDLVQWKTKTTEQLHGWKTRLDQAGIKSTYYFIAASVFLPVIQAVHHGDWSALAALGATIGSSVSTNLLANMVQKLKDKSDVDVALKLQAAASEDPRINAEIDALFKKLESLQQAELELATPEKQWFANTIQRELEQIKSGITFVASVNGDSVSVQGDGSRAVGKHGLLVEGNVAGDIFTGNHNNKVHVGTFIANQAINPPPRNYEEEKRLKGREKYLLNLYRRCQSLPLVALGDAPTSREDITLNDVYIGLDTTDKVEIKRDPKEKELLWSRQPGENERPVTAFEAFLKLPRIVLLGSPGSGKSTFVRNLLAMQSEIARGLREPLPGILANLIPVFVTLRDMVGKLDTLDYHKLSAERQDSVLVKVLDQQIAEDIEQIYRVPEFQEELQQAFDEGHILLALDGLDEVPERLRETMRLVVAAYQKAYDLPRIIMTCRIRSYAGTTEQPGFARSTLMPFSEKQVQNFSLAWYLAQSRLGKLDELQARQKANDLTQAALQNALRRLSENPMLLTTMAIIHQKETRLPNERVKLYSLAVLVLFERWQKFKVGDRLAVSDELASLLQDSKRVRQILERLAYEAHRVGNKDEKNTETDLPRKDALTILEGSNYLGSISLASEFLDYVDHRAGLLVGRGGDLEKPSIYGFAHRTFQEYLAGCYLINQRNAARILLEHAIEPEYWSLAIGFGAEELYYNGRTQSQNDVLDLAYALLAEKSNSPQLRRAALWSGKMTALVGANAVEADTSPQGGKGFLARLVPTLNSLLDSDLAPVERAEAGDALAVLGDLRTSILNVDEMEFCFVPHGQFWMGSHDEEGSSTEHPQHKLDLHDFWIGRYLVTQAQYKLFVEDGGYSYEPYWLEARDADAWKNGRVKGYNDDDYRTGPYDVGDPFLLPNHPVVGITWYEMLAFTRWLTIRWQKIGLLPDNWKVCLPSETEWEKSARGGLVIPDEAVFCSAKQNLNWNVADKRLSLRENPNSQRRYPWGNTVDIGKSNYRDTGIGTTSTVGCFPAGASPYGVLDMCGNVWEWTRSVSGDYPYPIRGRDLSQRENLAKGNSVPRILRGGAFDSYEDLLRCTYRLKNYPNLRLHFVGFRVAVTSF